jgi:hypothetical protein
MKYTEDDKPLGTPSGNQKTMGLFIIMTKKTIKHASR